ncbi:hypothetical protein; 6-mannosyl-glycoprotein 2-beta-N-acetylglucosaminyltransferase [Paratrimastix pyriformis]|uniref:Alpha-1,6-mannosyl-glycoprotein 2-beta-N-acetylglucosaminyltransferase n=1 Tax=Paratrimastix pyriformis TaxID=342808 RepID=A0ABQ8US04_9EUKA|nr:hypothetical protein; 6-mannosyl-glycoprotein 2-beta-N-acetylglucosaminyltransferase [Paratrimastix pyriformis]
MRHILCITLTISPWVRRSTLRSVAQSSCDLRTPAWDNGPVGDQLQAASRQMGFPWPHAFRFRLRALKSSSRQSLILPLGCVVLVLFAFLYLTSNLGAANAKSRKILLELQSFQKAWNRDGPVLNPTYSLFPNHIPLVLYVHNRPDNFRQVVEALRAVEGISETRLYISHDGKYPEMDAIARSIDFCQVKQLFLPVSSAQPAPPWAIKRHWWWLMHEMFQRQLPGYRGDLLFIEEDQLLAPDAYRYAQAASLFKSGRLGRASHCHSESDGDARARVSIGAAPEAGELCRTLGGGEAIAACEGDLPHWAQEALSRMWGFVLRGPDEPSSGDGAGDPAQILAQLGHSSGGYGFNRTIFDAIKEAEDEFLEVPEDWDISMHNMIQYGYIGDALLRPAVTRLVTIGTSDTELEKVKACPACLTGL